MQVLVIGASGFIAGQIVTDLLLANHSVTCCGRNTAYIKTIFPQCTVIPCDFIRDITAEHWLDRLAGIDVVINCVGILHHPNKKITWAVHYHTPVALFNACVKAGIKKIIQISALGVEHSDVEYAKSKKAAEDFLLTLPIKSVILRPSFVYGRGSYGGSSLFRGLAGLPGILPVPGKGAQEFQPIHLQDLAKAVVKLTETPLNQSIILSAVGPKRITLTDVLQKLRAWLGFSRAKLLFIPLWFIKLGSFFGSAIPYSAMNMTSYKMLLQSNIASEKETQQFHEVIGFTPRDYDAGLFSQPSTVQDHWHARLFFLKPLLQIGIAFMWIGSALCSAFFSTDVSYALLTQIGVTAAWQPFLLYSASALDAILGIALLCNFQLKKVLVLQILVILIYTAIISWTLPFLWLDPFATIAKNIPILVATLIFLAMESDR